VKFWGVKSLFGFRYGKEHHALVGGFVVHVNDNREPGQCFRTFEEWATPMMEAFEVRVAHEPPTALVWNGAIASVDPFSAQVASLADRDAYAAAYVTYPAWPGACLILGIAVPVRGEPERAKAVRDKFLVDVFPKLGVVAAQEPEGRF
jgi:hypothetical protein